MIEETLETLEEMLETGSACIEADGNCNICKAKNKCKLPKTKILSEAFNDTNA